MGGDFVGLAISGIPALSSVIKAWENAREKNKVLSSEEIDRVITDTEKSFPVSEAARAVVQRDNNFRLLWENLAIAQNRLIESLIDPKKTNKDKEKEIKIACETICNELKRIQELNNGQLPDKDLENIWVLYKCSSENHKN